MEESAMVRSQSKAGDENRVLDNFEQLRQELREWHFSWDVRRQFVGDFRGSTSSRSFGEVALADFSYDAVRGKRTGASISRAEDDYIGLALFINGGQHYSQGRQEAITCARDLFIWDATRPASFCSQNGTRLLNILFPRSLILQHVPDIEGLSCRRIGPENGNGEILASHLAAVHRTIDRVPPGNRSNVFRATLELVASCFQPDDALRGDSRYKSLMLRKVQAYVYEAMLEPDFSVSSVAAHFDVSPRYLYRLFSSSGTSFTQWLRNERLVRARKALASPAFSAESITELATRFGFCDSAHFCRSFKLKYGCSPKQFRSTVR